MDTYLCSGCDRKSWLYQKVSRHGSDVSEISTSHRYVMSLYFAVVTMTTTGYGDIGAHYGEGFLISIVLIIVGMLIFAYALSVLAATLANRDAPKYTTDLHYKYSSTKLSDGAQMAIFGDFFASCISSEPRAAGFRPAF